MEIGHQEMRQKMVAEQLIPRGIMDSRVLAAMAKVPRHLFVGNDLQAQAYDDCPLPIGEEQTISQPYMVALMAEALQLEGRERVLEVGTGSGYEAAVLAELCKEVFTVELIEVLAIKARQLLSSLGYRNVSVLVGDGTLGWKEHAPYDCVVVSAAAPGIPRPLFDQLKPGGSLVAPMGERQLQSLIRLRKAAAGLKEEYLGECRFVKLRGEHGWDETGEDDTDER